MPLLKKLFLTDLIAGKIPIKNRAVIQRHSDIFNVPIVQ